MQHSPDFWTFYKLNKKYVEAILHGICKNYSDTIDFDDLHQELLITLHRSNFLKNFDPKKSKLSTYFYYYAHFRARHVIKAMKESIKENKIGTPVYIDHGRDFGDGEIYEDVEDTKVATPDAALEEADFKSAVSDTLKSKHLYEVFNFFEEGYNQSEIAKMYGVSRMTMSYQFSDIKTILKEFVASERRKKGMKQYA